MNIRLGKVEIPTTDYATQGNAILGIRDSGKTYTATCIAEQLIDAGVPIIAFDPIGVWRYLKVPAPNGGKGYSVVVAGGEHGDIPLKPESATEIVRAAMHENIPLIIDLYSMELHKTDWKHIVETCIRLLLYENKPHGIRHVFLEEAAEFCPQKINPGDGKVYAEIEKLARMGGNASLGLTLINQRSEQVNKAVLELCELLLLHRQRGRNSLTAVEKWLRFGKGKSMETTMDIAELPAGECYVWPSGKAPERVKIQAKKSLHPDRRNPWLRGSKEASLTVNVSAFVERINGLLQKEEKEKESIESMMDTPDSMTTPDADEISTLKQVVSDYSGRISKYGQREEKLIHEFDDIGEIVRTVHAELSNIALTIKTLETRCTFMRTILNQTPDEKAGVPATHWTDSSTGLSPAFLVATPSRSIRVDGTKVGKAEMAILCASAQRWKSGKTSSTRAQLAILSRYSVTSSSFSNALSLLRKFKWIDGSGDQIHPTNAGLRAAGNVAPLPSGKDLLAHWVHDARLGRAESLILQAVHRRKTATYEQIAADTGYSHTSSSFSNALSKLRTLEFIERGNPVKISQDFL